MNALNYLNKNMFAENYKPYGNFNRANGDYVLLPDGKCVYMMDGIINGFPPC